MNSFKCLVIGAPLTGKTSLINTFMSGSFDGYKPKAVLTTYDVNFIYNLDSLKKDLKENGHDPNLVELSESNQFNFKIYDYDLERPKHMDKVDLIILCYQRFSRKSKEYLLNEASKFISINWPGVPCVLVSCFSDLNERVEDDLSRKLKAKKCFECSALENYNVNRLFIESFKLTIIERLAKKPEKVECVRLKYDDELKNDWVICESKVKLNREIIGVVGGQAQLDEKIQTYLNQNLKSTRQVNLWKSASRLVLSVFAFACLCMYLFTYHYCNRNKNHCDEIYELGKDAFDDSLSTLNESYVSLIHQFNRFKK